MSDAGSGLSAGSVALNLLRYVGDLPVQFVHSELILLVLALHLWKLCQCAVFFDIH